MKLASLLLPSLRASDSSDDWFLYGWFNRMLGRQTSAGERVSPESAMRLSVYYACMRNISEDIGKLPMIVYRLNGEAKVSVPDHPLYKLLHDDVSEEMSSMSFRETLTSWALGWGNGYAEIQRDGAGRPIALWPIHPWRVTVRRIEGRIVYDVRSDITLEGRPYESVRLLPEDVFHLKGLGDGIVGYSVARLAAESLGLSIAAQSFGAAFFGNGATLGGVLEHPGKLDDKARANLRESWQAMHGGPKGAHKTAILEQGLKYTRIGIPPDEAQFLETRNFQTYEVCRWFRMQPHKVQQLDRATFSNIESQNTEYVGDTLTSWAARWEHEIRRKLVFDRRIFAELQFMALLRGDSNARANYYRTMINIGSMSPNEVRIAESMNPGDEALDEYYMQSNMLPLKKIGEQTTRAPVPHGGAPFPPNGDQPKDGQDDDSEKQESEEQLRAQLAALRPVFLEAADRVLRKEVLAVQKAVERCKGDRARFAAWAAEFYAEQRRFLVEAMTPPLQVAASIVAHIRGEPLAEAEIELVLFARDHAARSQAACESSGGAELLAENAAANLADRILALAIQQEPSHAQAPA